MARRRLTHESVQQAAQNWANGYAQSGNAIRQGVANPRRDPTAAAIAAQSTMLANLTQAITSGRWANALRAAGQASWQAGMINKTIPSLAVRSQAGMPHFQAFLQAWMPGLTSFIQQLPARGDYNVNKQRMISTIDYMHQQRGNFRKAWRGGAGGLGNVPGVGALGLGGP